MVMALTVTHVSCLLNYAEATKLRHISSRTALRKVTGIATAGDVTVRSSAMEGHIEIAISFQEHKTGTFNTTAGVTIKFVLDRFE